MGGISDFSHCFKAAAAKSKNAKGDTMVIFHKEIDVKYDVDVLVAGGGPSGVAAAVFAKRAGADVMLVEGTASLGGLGTSGLVPFFMHFTNGVDFLADGFGREILERMWAIGGKVDKSQYSIKVEALKKAYDEMMENADVPYLLMTQIIDVEAEDEVVKYVVCSGKSGIYAIKAREFIDATGDGDLCAWAGAPYEKGDEKGSMMAGTLCTLWGGIDWDKVKKPDTRELEKAFEDGVFTNEDRHLPGMWKVGDKLGGGNIGHTDGVDGTDEESLTKALIHGRKSIREYEKYFKEYLADGYKDMELVVSGAILGVRETRRIMGDYKMGLDDFIKRAVFDDEIGRFSYPVDIHASKASKENYDTFLNENTSYEYKKGESYGIPYRALLPRKIKNMFVVGRCLSCDRYMQSSIRVMPGCYITGQAAGAASALALEAGNDIRKVDVGKLQKKLKEMGAFLPNAK